MARSLWLGCTFGLLLVGCGSNRSDQTGAGDAAASVHRNDPTEVRRRLRLPEAPPALFATRPHARDLFRSSPIEVSSPIVPPSNGSSVLAAPIPSRAQLAVLPALIAPVPDSPGRYVQRGNAATTFFTERGLSFSLRSRVEGRGWGLHATLVGAKEGGWIGERPTGARVHQYIGRESAWATDLRAVEQVVREDVYPGIDMVAATARSGVEYELILSPGAHLEDIKFRWEGATAVHATNDGRGVDVETGIGVLRVRGLRAFAVRGEQRVELAARHEVGADGVVSIAVNGWDGTTPLIIDPTVTWSTYLGGSAGGAGTNPDEAVRGIAVDSAGNVLVTGDTQSTDFPTTGGFDTTRGAYLADAYVTKMSSAGVIVWSTYLGGATNDVGSAIAIDATNNAWVAGSTDSTDFPIASGFDTTLGGATDAFVAKVGTSGTLLFSSYFGGTSYETTYAIAADPSGNAVVTGQTNSSDFPSTGGFDTTLGGTCDAFVTKISAAGALSWSSFLGGSGIESGYAVAVDGSGNAYLTGTASSSDFPTTGGFDATLGGTSDAFVTKVTSAGALSWSSYLGGANDDEGKGIAVDGSGNAFVTGRTFSSDFPTAGGFDTTFGGSEGFVTKVSGGGALVWSSFFGGSGGELGNAIALTSSGDAVITGLTTSTTGFPTTGGFDATFGGVTDAFVIKVTSAGALSWGSYLGGAQRDEALAIAMRGDSIFVGGYTASSDFPTSSGLDTTLDNLYDGFVAKISDLGANGSACTSGTQCGSTNCVDGVCCDTACTALCNACTTAKKGSGANGTCGAIADGSDPDTECGAASCAAGVVTNKQVCNGAGACRANGTTPCAPYACSGAGCATSCAIDTDCAASAFCSGTTCAADLANGAACTRNAQCSSGSCVDGVCCDTACAGACEACTATKKGSGADGACGFIGDGADPDAECVAASCTAGVVTRASLCNGSGACRSNGTISCGLFACAGAACATTCGGDGDCASTAMCSGGTCVARPVDAGTDTANPDTADTAMPDTADAAMPDTADTAMPDTADTAMPDTAMPDTAVADTAAPDTSVPETVAPTDPGEKPVVKGDAQPCANASECSSGFCVDGVCCNTACNETCHSCALPQAPGKCTLQPLGYDLRRECNSEQSCFSTCGTRGECVPAFAGSRCQEPKCTSRSKGVGVAVCSDLKGACQTDRAITFDCSPYACEGAFGACRETCRKSDDCADGFICDTAAARCVPAPAVEEDSGCAIGSSPSSRSASTLVSLTFAVAALGLARRRSRAR